MVEEGIHQCASPMSRRRMDDEAGRLIQEQQDIILVEDLKRNCLAFEFQRFCFWNVERDVVAWLDLLAGFDDLTVNPHTPLAD